MGLAGQGYRRKYPAALRLDIALQIRQRAAHAHKIIHQHVFASRSHRAFEFGLSGQPPKPVGSGMGHHIDLHHPCIDGPSQHFSELVGKYLGNSVDAFALEGMRAYQGGCSAWDEVFELKRFVETEGGKDEIGRCIVVSCLRRLLRRMLLNCRLSGVNQHVGEVAPCSTWRFDVLKHWPYFPTPISILNP